MLRYVVQPGDTLFNIARRFNITVQSIIQLNNIQNPDLIRVGEALLIDTGTGADNQQPVQPSPEVRRPSNNTNISGLRYTLSADRQVYRRGETVRLRFTKCNTSNSRIVLRYPTTQRYDFAAYRDGQEIWRWSNDQAFAQVVGRETLTPGQCRTYTGSWNLRDRRGNPVPAGTYQVRAYNVARNYENRFVYINIRVEVPDSRPGTGNLLSDPSIERWVSPTNPAVWSGQNVRRTTVAHSGRYAAELGATPNRQAILSQTAEITAGRLYRITFWGREIQRARNVANFRLEVEILLYDRTGRLIGRVDPVYSPAAIPANRYQQYSFSTGLLPRGTARGNLRFNFNPRSNNTNSVAIDDVSLVFVR